MPWTRRQLAALQAMGIPVWQRRAQGESPTDTAVQDAVVEDPHAEPAAPVSRAASEAVPVPEQVDDVATLDWEALEARVQSCRRCALAEGRNRVVFGDGNRSADWMFIGEGPGAEEDRQGLPFVGRAGKLLDRMIEACGMQRGDVYIANVVKCRPPGNRDPKPEEVAACAPYLRRQIELVSPRVIVVLGRVAAHALLDTDSPLGRLRGAPHLYDDTGIPMIVTYHPAYLLRNPADKRKAWEDLKLAMRLAGATP
ncbi:MAG: uracil-DNA glycosylase [Gammaproteobacteria bacterium]|nr:MAG: uracil-DNA glycosylase [Gammaproteobacteria bacterium]